jgi:hypothetical protein
MLPYTSSPFARPDFSTRSPTSQETWNNTLYATIMDAYLSSV